MFSSYKGAWNPDWLSDGVLGLMGPNDDSHSSRSSAKLLAERMGDEDGAIISFHLNG